MTANSNAFFWQKNPSLGFKENDLNPFKDATFLPTLAAAMEEQKIQLTICPKFWTLTINVILPGTGGFSGLNFLEIPPKNWQTHMSEGIKNWKNGTKKINRTITKTIWDKKKDTRGKATKLTLHQNKPQQGQMQHEVRLTGRNYLRVGNQKKLLRSHLLLLLLLLHSRLWCDGILRLCRRKTNSIHHALVVDEGLDPGVVVSI